MQRYKNALIARGYEVILIPKQYLGKIRKV
jgi:hypothetical protein